MGNKRKSYPNFLKEEKEPLQLIRRRDWTSHPLGLPQEWPNSLRIALNMVSNSYFPSILFWNSEYYCFCNSAFLSALSEEQHSNITGEAAKNIWPDRWTPLHAFIEETIQKQRKVTDSNFLLSDCFESTHFTPLKNEDGEVVGVIATCVNETSKSGLKQKVKNLHDEKKQILKSIIDGFFILNNEWSVTHWNDEAENMLGIPRNKILGKNIWEVIPEEKSQRFQTEFKEAVKTNSPSSFEQYYPKWGRWFNYNIYPYEHGLLVHLRDISRHRRLQLINKRTEEISGVAGWELDLSTEEVFITSKGYEIYGLEEDVEINLEINQKLFDKESLEKIDHALQKALEHQQPYSIELNLLKNDGNRIICINGFPLVRSGKVTKLYGTIEDITQEKRNKQKLEESIQKLKKAQKIGKMGSWTMDPNKKTNDWSDEMFNILEVDSETFNPTFENLMETVHPDDRHFFEADINSRFSDKNYQEFEHRIITFSGKTKWIRARITLHRDENGSPQVLEGISQDISEEKRQEEEILQTLKEKETLLEEVHHRVKNNLAVISSMLQLQAYEESEDVKEKLMDSVVRIISMASIHEVLYKSHSFSKLDLSDSLKKVTKRIVETMDYNTKIVLDFKLDPVEVNINQAIPCSLILNEVITNVIKHAFKGKPNGKIQVFLSEINNHIEISINDNGIGIPDDFDIEENKTLGVRLIDTLATQLDGNYLYKPLKKGTSFTLKFEKSNVKGSGSFHFKE